MAESREKNNGMYYTPPQLADFIVSLSIHNKNVTVLDPAFGQGALLLATLARLKILGRENPNEQLYGYDIQPLCKEYQKTHFIGLLNEINLIERDFFKEQYDSKTFDVVLMNPPFVRHHKLDKSYLIKIRNMINTNINLPNTSDLWAYFIVYSLNFINKHGSLAAILPWAFVQADYARCVRYILYNQFETLNIVIIGKKMFEKAQERILIFFGENYGSPTKKINIYYSFDIPKSRIHFNKISKQTWFEAPFNQLTPNDMCLFLNNIAGHADFRLLKEFVQIKIGTVTGANSFFILDNRALKTIKPSKQLLRPIIKHAYDLTSLEIDEKQKCRNFLLIIPPKLDISGDLKEYIESGQAKDLHRRYHTKKRDPWYSIDDPIPPDGFMPYMSKEIPFIALNGAKMLSTNSVHQIFFYNNTDKNIQKWIQFSMFSSLSQLSIELCAKTYGGGVLKIEPSSAKQIFVFSGNGEVFPEELGNEVNELVVKGKKRDAVEFVDNWIVQHLNVAKNDMAMIRKNYEFLRNVRLNMHVKST